MPSVALSQTAHFPVSALSGKRKFLYAPGGTCRTPGPRVTLLHMRKRLSPDLTEMSD